MSEIRGSQPPPVGTRVKFLRGWMADLVGEVVAHDPVGELAKWAIGKTGGKLRGDFARVRLDRPYTTRWTGHPIDLITHVVAWDLQRLTEIHAHDFATSETAGGVVCVVADPGRRAPGDA